MPALPKIEVASGAIDGVNQTFTVSGPYVAFTVAVFLNGQLKRRDFVDGWAETNPAGGAVTLAEPPQAGDVVQVYFLDALAAGQMEVVEVCPLVGTIDFDEDLTGVLSLEHEICAEVVLCH